MKNIIKLTLISLLGVAPFVLSSCGTAVSEGNVEYLRVLNWEDYIYLQEEEGDLPDLTVQFEEYMKKTHNRNVKVIYDTFDTNETMLNSIKTGKYVYDLLCPSDYMIQRMAANDMLEKFDKSMISNYFKNSSPYLQEAFEKIETTNKVTNETLNLGDYAAGYMWGTLGILYNPTYKEFVSRGYETEEVIEDMNDWNVLWDEKYHKTIAIKDSMRDTYSVGIMRAYDNDFKEAKKRYENKEITATEYNDIVSVMFNYGGEKDKDAVTHINAVEKELLSLRNNIFGFEVDSGKEDIVTGKTGINIAWSGDAVYSMDKAESADETANPFELYYSIPETGGNIWFDGWCMQKGANKELAAQFINFLSEPVNAAMNMNYIGYTSFIGGTPFVDLIHDWYDARTYILYASDDDGELLVDDDGNYIKNEGYEDYDYFSLPESELEGLHKIDLSYFFDGTYDKEEYKDKDGNYINPAIFYSDTIGRQFSGQYPDGEIIPSLSVMADYGSNNELIINMWENVKSEGLPTWAMIMLIVEVGAIIIAIGGITIYKKTNKTIRKKRKELA